MMGTWPTIKWGQQILPTSSGDGGSFLCHCPIAPCHHYSCCRHHHSNREPHSSAWTPVMVNVPVVLDLDPQNREGMSKGLLLLL